MYNIRLATQADFGEVAKMTENFKATVDDVTLDYDMFIKYLCKAVDDGLLIVAETDDGSIVGMIVGMRVPSTFNPNEQIVMELLWWVEQEYRNSSVGIRLLKELYDRCLPGETIHMSLLAQSGVKESSMEKLGYKKLQTTYTTKVK